MLIRLTALVVSLLVHAAFGYALWPRLQNSELEILDFGSGMDIELMPQGLVTSAVANRGDDIESIETQDVVPMDQRKPPPKPTDANPDSQLHDVAETSVKSEQTVAALEERKQSSETPVEPHAQQLSEVREDAQREHKSDIEDVEERKPALSATEVSGPQPLPDVSAPSQSQATQAIAALDEQSPTTETAPVASSQQLNDMVAAPQSDTKEEVRPIEMAKPAQQSTSAPAKSLGEVIDSAPTAEQHDVASVPLEKHAAAQSALSPAEPMRDVSIFDQKPVDDSVATAPQSPTPGAIGEAKAAKAGELPLPDELKESAISKITEHPPQKPISEDTPDSVEVLVRPTQVAIVSELSSGEEKKGGDARVVNIYLGKINDQMQRAKVNPRTSTTGVVILRFKVGTDGQLLSKEVALSSGSPTLDAAALSTLLRAAPFPAIPTEVSTTPMVFSQLFRFVVR